ncbi:hypothetical protein MF672_035560 [Actinomadura sp. ATCC 31491]|uniref:Regulatory protein n=1 Tax=Actinomadura luzonensis TaxID=2805427 RepID=A0ABT0G4F2_9ACTN|nr:hypothetical protein [Actinomadura luzonensis]MCK2219075.1 hypothetical protein [Actinomadura luzonensis]
MADGEAAFGTVTARRALAARWQEGGARLAAGVGFDAAALTAETVERQLDVERSAGPGTGLLALTAPTEEAVAAAFAHTATLAGRPGNAAPLAEAGRFFGRLAHLLDAVEDGDGDAARGAFNPLAATGTSREEARRLCEDAAHGLDLALREADLADRHLVDVLLGAEVRRAIGRAFAAAETASYERPGWVRKSAAGIGTFLTCGLWRPRWSRRAGRPCEDRCYFGDGSCCECGNCCNCGNCCDCCSGCD